MNGHDPDQVLASILRKRRPEIHLVTDQFVNIPDKMEQSSVAGLLIGDGLLHQHVQIGLLLTAALGCLGHSEKSGFIVYLPQKLVDRRVTDMTSESVRHLPKLSELLIKRCLLLRRASSSQLQVRSLTGRSLVRLFCFILRCTGGPA